MEFQRYDSVEDFRADVLGLLMEKEAENNLLISMLTENSAKHTDDWLMATVVDGGNISLVALCSKPFNLLLFEPEGSNCGAVETLAREIRRIAFSVPGILAESGLARRFAGAYSADGSGKHHISMVVMYLDILQAYDKAPGNFREIEERDMFFVPFWEHAFGEDCRIHVFPLPEVVKRIRTRLGKGTHFLWEDGTPVSQAVFGRGTPNGAIINMVYTPPHLRGRGYATAVVGELSRMLLESGKSFCGLFADTYNPVSCNIYRKLGYRDIGIFDDIRF